MATTTWRPPDDVYEDLRLEAFRSRRSINELLTEAVREWLRQHRDSHQEGATE